MKIHKIEDGCKCPVCFSEDLEIQDLGILREWEDYLTQEMHCNDCGCGFSVETDSVTWYMTDDSLKELDEDTVKTNVLRALYECEESEDFTKQVSDKGMFYVLKAFSKQGYAQEIYFGEIEDGQVAPLEIHTAAARLGIAAYYS